MIQVERYTIQNLLKQNFLFRLTSQIFAVQHVDVCMFSNGKFKNVVADINESHEIRPGELHRKVYSLLPIKGKCKTKNEKLFTGQSFKFKNFGN